jgi:thymidine phosphorylase
LGAGRTRKEHPVSPGAGVVLHARPGDEVVAGRPLMTLHTDDPARFEWARAALADAVTIAPAGARPEPAPLVLERIA